MILWGNEPDFPVDGVGTCLACKRSGVEVRTLPDGRAACADLSRCALAIIGVPDDVLRAEIPAGEAWVL